MNPDLLVLGVLIIVVGAVIYFKKHPDVIAPLKAELDKFSSSLHSRLDGIHAAALAPVSVVQLPPPAPVPVVMPAPAAPEPAVAAPQPGPSVTDLLFAQPVAAPAAPVPTAQPAAASPVDPDLWPNPPHRWSVGTLQPGVPANAHYIVTDGWAGDVTISPSGFYNGGLHMEIDGKLFDGTPFASPDPRTTPGRHELTLLAAALCDGSVDFYHNPR